MQEREEEEMRMATYEELRDDPVYGE